MSTSYLIKYPFTKEALKHLQTLEIDIFSLAKNYSEVFESAVENVEMILDNGEYITKKLYPGDEVLLYPITKMLIEIINNDFLRFKFADIVSKRTQVFLSKESFDLIGNIAVNTFNWKLLFGDFEFDSKCDFKLKFNNYLQVAPRDSNWKLVNRKLEDGWVFLKKKEIIRLISEKVKRDITKKSKNKRELPQLPPEIEKIVTQLQEKAQKYKRTIDLKFRGNIITNEETYPPCIREILTRLKEGENLDHTSRLVFLFFLLNIGKNVEEIVDLFKAQPDFNQQKTTYYIEHAAGKRGSGTQYSSYGCAKIRTYGLCRAEEDIWCRDEEKKIKNPMNYFKKKNWKLQNVVIPRILAFPFLITSTKIHHRNLH
ncbi:MAG: hypothetical protein ACTSRG_02715 [Candidatus Helarchaeota archaeon]